MTEGAGVAARAMLDRLVTQPAWAAVRLRDSATVTLVGGTLSTVQRLADVPLEEGAPQCIEIEKHRVADPDVGQTRKLRLEVADGN
jgi:hypothetical protein